MIKCITNTEEKNICLIRSENLGLRMKKLKINIFSHLKIIRSLKNELENLNTESNKDMIKI